MSVRTTVGSQRLRRSHRRRCCGVNVARYSSRISGEPIDGIQCCKLFSVDVIEGVHVTQSRTSGLQPRVRRKNLLNEALALGHIKIADVRRRPS